MNPFTKNIGILFLCIALIGVQSGCASTKNNNTVTVYKPKTRKKRYLKKSYVRKIRKVKKVKMH